MRRLLWPLTCLAISLAVAACSKSQEEAKAPEAAPPEPRGRRARAGCGCSCNRCSDRQHRPLRGRQRPGCLAAPRRGAEVHGAAARAACARLLRRRRLLHRADVARGRSRGQGHRVQQRGVSEVREDAPAKRYGSNRLPNVTEVTTPVESGRARSRVAGRDAVHAELSRPVLAAERRSGRRPMRRKRSRNSCRR